MGAHEVCTHTHPDSHVGPTPDLSSTPFGYAEASTGGSTNESAVYVASTLAELKEAVELPYTKTVYVNGTIHGNELADGRRILLS